MTVPEDTLGPDPSSRTTASQREPSDMQRTADSWDDLHSAQAVTIELSPEEIAALESLIDGTATDPQKVAQQLGVKHHDMAQSVVRYILSPAYMGDFLQVLNSLDMQASEILRAAETMERESDGVEYVRAIREASGGMLELFLDQETADRESKPKSRSGWVRPLLWTSSGLVGFVLLVGMLAFFFQPSPEDKTDVPERVTADEPVGMTEGYSLVHLKSTPPYADVRLDDEPLPLKTDLWLNLKPGVYHLVVKKEGFQTTTKTLVVKQAEQKLQCVVELKREKGTLAPKFQTVVLRTVPSGASFEIRSPRLLGKTEAELELVPGTYGVMIAKSGYYPRNESLRVVASNEPQIFQYLLTPEGTTPATIQVTKLPPPPEAMLAVQFGRGVEFGAVCLVLDRSERMAQKIGEKKKWDLLLDAVGEALPTLPKGTRLSVLTVSTKSVNGKSSPNVLWVQKEKPWDPKQMPTLLAKLSLLVPNGSAPLTAAMERAVAHWKNSASQPKGPRTLVVLTGGPETTLSDPAKTTSAKAIQEKLQTILKGNEIAADVICYSDELAEIKKAKNQFEGVNKLALESNFWATEKLNDLTAATRKALMPVVRLLDSKNKQIANLTLGIPGSQLRAVELPVTNPKGEEFLLAGRGVASSRRVRLLPGDALLVEVQRDKKRFHFQRGRATYLAKKSVFGIRAKGKGPPEPGDVTVAIAGMEFDVEKGQLEQLVCVESIPIAKPKANVPLQLFRPSVVWCEVEQHDGKPVAELRWQRAYHLPGTTYRIWAKELPTGKQPVTRMWIPNEAGKALPDGVSKTLTMTVEGAGLSALAGEYKIPGGADSLPVQLRSRFKTRSLPMSDGTKGPQKCLVFKVAHPKGRPVLLRLSGANHLGEKHIAKPVEGKYEAIFWGSRWNAKTKLRVELISVEHFKTKTSEYRWRRLPNTRDGVIIPFLPKFGK